MGIHYAKEKNLEQLALKDSGCEISIITNRRAELVNKWYLRDTRLIEGDLYLENDTMRPVGWWSPEISFVDMLDPLRRMHMTHTFMIVQDHPTLKNECTLGADFTQNREIKVYETNKFILLRASQRLHVKGLREVRVEIKSI
jgi:hypothetical protein